MNDVILCNDPEEFLRHCKAQVVLCEETRNKVDAFAKTLYEMAGGDSTNTVGEVNKELIKGVYKLCTEELSKLFESSYSLMMETIVPQGCNAYYAATGERHPLDKSY